MNTECAVPHDKSNPIEHRLFSAISRNWAGRPPDSWEPVLNYISTTTTRTGLQVRSVRVPQQYQTGVKITKQQMAGLKLVRSENLPQWNYRIHPLQTDLESELPLPCPRPELLPACLRQGSSPSPGELPELAHQPNSRPKTAPIGQSRACRQPKRESYSWPSPK